jgi:HPt (histidine-containing phosphotransfer) domain-containing protein
MSHESQSRPPLYTQLEVSAAAANRPAQGRDRDDKQQTELLTNILGSLDRQNELLEELVGHLCQQQRQRTQELNQWRAANPGLVRNCRRAAETLSHVQTEFLHTLTSEVNENREALADGEFVLNEFVDRFGPRLAHLNSVLTVLAQLSGNGATAG